ncbi:MAG: extracellular solute-binding protein [Christensenellales bacterium]
MKKLYSLLLVLALVLTCCSAALAESLLPYAGEEVVYEGFAADLGISENRDSEVYKAYKETIGNVTIEWATGPWADFNTKTSMFLNTGDLPDIVWLGGSRNIVANYGEMGYFLNFMDYLDYMPNLKQYLADFPQLEYMKAASGALYCVNDLEPVDHIDESFFYNKTALDSLGLDVPKTWDEMLAAMRAYKAAVPESTPFITYGWGLGYYQNCIGSILNAKRDYYYDGEKWVHPLTTEESGYRALTEMLSTMYADGLLHPEFSTMSDNQAFQIIQDGNWLFTFFYNNAIYNEVFQRQEAPFEYKPMLAPAFKEGDPVYALLTVPYDNIPGWGYFVSAEVENPELMCALVDHIISPEASKLFNWGVEGVSYEVDADGNRHYLEDFATNSERARAFGMGNFMDVRYIQYKMRDSEFQKNGDIAKEAYRLVVGALLDGTAVGIRALRSLPNLSAAEAEIVARSNTPFKTYIDENIMYFIDGTRPMSEWDDFVNETFALGNLEEVLKIYEEAPQIIYSTERRYKMYD